MWKLIGVEEDIVLGLNYWLDFGVSIIDIVCYSLFFRYVFFSFVSSFSWRVEGVIGEVYFVYVFFVLKGV